MRWLLAAVTGVLIGLSTVAVGTANAEPSQPGPTPTSTSDELADMVLDVIEHGGAAAPTTTPAPAPPP
jgi:hypothetical protein